MRADRLGELIRIDTLLADIGRLQNLQIASWQKLAGLADVAGIAAELHAVLGGAERGRADALAGREQRPWQRAGIDARADRAAETASHVAEVAVLAAIDVFADAAGEHHPVDAAELGNRIGQIEMLDRVRHRTLRERRHQQIRHARRDFVELRRREHVAARPVEAGLAGVKFSRRIEPHDPADVVDHLQPTADMQRSRRGHVTVLDDTELGGAAADVDVEDAFTLLVRQLRRTRAVGRQHRLHVVPGGGGDEIAALLRQQGGDRLGILAAQRLAGEDDHAGVDILWLDARRRIGLVDDGAERGVVDALVARIGRQRHRRLEQGLPRYDVVAAGEVLAIAAQVNAGEDHLRARRTDVDADRHQRHMVLDPDRVLFQPLVAVELEMIVVVIGVAVVLVHDVLAEQVIGDRMAAFAILGHSSLLLAAPQRSHAPRARALCYRTARLRWSKRGPLEIARRSDRGPQAHKSNVPARASLTEPGRAVTLRSLLHLPGWM